MHASGGSPEPYHNDDTSVLRFRHSHIGRAQSYILSKAFLDLNVKDAALVMSTLKLLEINESGH